MKRKNFKVRRTTLFIYQNSVGINQLTTETETTTNTIILTKTGIFGGL
jgi:hypothetical protein